MQKEWDRSAMRFASARYVDRQWMLDVTFENGDHFLVAAESVLPETPCAPYRGVSFSGVSRAAYWASFD
jgi:hypothetical protein